MKNIKTAIQTEEEKQFTTVYNSIKGNTKDQTKLKMPESFTEQGVYKWLTNLPLVSYYLGKRTFWDSIRTWQKFANQTSS